MNRRKAAALLGILWALGLMTAPAFSSPQEPFPVPGRVTVVDFGASWCASCPEMEALMKKLQEAYGDRAAFVTVDIDRYRGIEDKYLIEQLPAQLFYSDKGELIWQHAGPLEEAVLKERVDRLLSGRY